ncbi:MAG: prenyltransferase [Planctomycetota bacterium]
MRVLLPVLLLIGALRCSAGAEALGPDAATAGQRGLAALVALQHGDGSFSEIHGINALAGMALLAGGHTPERGTYRQASRRCLDHLLEAQDPLTGFIGDRVGTMYSHGFATLYLAECYGMSGDDRVREALAGALDCIFRAQNHEGGWRYNPAEGDADISVTVCQINAIRAAYNTGLGGDSAQQVVTRALGYVRACHNGDGSFRYQADMGRIHGGRVGPDAVSRSAAGVMSLMGGGVYNLGDPMVAAGLDLLRRFATVHAEQQGHYYWYGQYYAAQALFMSRRPEDWGRYWERIAQLVPALQGGDGLWRGPDDWGPAYNTAMALLVLQIPNEYLPIFQR